MKSADIVDHHRGSAGGRSGSTVDTGVRPSFFHPARYARINVEGTAQVLEIARARKIRTFAMASSSSVYGNSSRLPAREDEPAIVPESPYAASKRSAELM